MENAKWTDEVVSADGRIAISHGKGSDPWGEKKETPGSKRGKTTRSSAALSRNAGGGGGGALQRPAFLLRRPTAAGELSLSCGSASLPSLRPTRSSLAVASPLDSRPPPRAQAEASRRPGRLDPTAAAAATWQSFYMHLVLQTLQLQLIATQTQHLVFNRQQ
ncbi:hypothetical protein BS78_01G453700 [Paspalum vaginatum]|nr:hypothetical protein BS78_01G453700 [Paspalum vaginatum]